MKLLTRDFPQFEYHSSVLDHNHIAFSPHPTIHIHHTGNHHFVTSSSTTGQVIMYDSLNLTLTEELFLQLSCLYSPHKEIVPTIYSSASWTGSKAKFAQEFLKTHQTLICWATELKLRVSVGLIDINLKIWKKMRKVTGCGSYLSKTPLNIHSCVHQKRNTFSCSNLFTNICQRISKDWLTRTWLTLIRFILSFDS